MCTAKTERAFGPLGVLQYPVEKERGRCTRRRSCQFWHPNKLSKCIHVMDGKGINKRQKGRCHAATATISCMSQETKIRFMARSLMCTPSRLCPITQGRSAASLAYNCVQWRSLQRMASKPVYHMWHPIEIRYLGGVLGGYPSSGETEWDG